MKRAVRSLVIAATLGVGATCVFAGQTQLLGNRHDANTVVATPVAYRGYYRRPYRPYYRPYGVYRPYYGYRPYPGYGYGYGYGGYGYGFRPGVSVWF